MKLLCLNCDQQMTSQTDEGNETDASLSLSFVCPECGRQVELLTNPAETQLATSIGYTASGRKAPPQPMEMVRRKLAGGRTLGEAKTAPIWTEAAERRLAAAPNFVQGMIRALYTDYALQQGYEQVTPAVMSEAKEALGMEGL